MKWIKKLIKLRTNYFYPVFYTDWTDNERLALMKIICLWMC